MRSPFANQSDGVLEFSTLLKPMPTKETLSKMARTDQEIERLKEEARTLGFAEGKNSGYPAGQREGYDAGYAEGIQQGTDLKHQEVEALIERTDQHVKAALETWFEKAEPGLAQLAILIAERIVAKELSTSQNAVLSMVKEAVAEVTHATKATIRVRIADREILESRRSEVLSSAPSLRDLVIVEDESVTAGCIIETDGGVVAATVDLKFNEMLEAIRRAS